MNNQQETCLLLYPRGQNNTVAQYCIRMWKLFKIILVVYTIKVMGFVETDSYRAYLLETSDLEINMGSERNKRFYDTSFLPSHCEPLT